MPCNAPYNALHDLIVTTVIIHCNTYLIHCYTFRKYDALKQMTNKPSNIIMYFNFGYNYL